MLYGYARVSTTDQDLRVQEAALHAAGCAVVRTEKKSGATRLCCMDQDAGAVRLRWFALYAKRT